MAAPDDTTRIGDAGNGGGDVTRLLTDSANGSTEARDRLLELVHAELMILARSRMRAERGGHTLSATALVSEVFLRLFRESGNGGPATPMAWADRREFFQAAVTAMRRILVDHARSRAALKRGGGRRVEDVAPDAVACMDADPNTLLSLDEALSRLEKVDARAASVVRLRFFGGLDHETVGELLGLSDRTVKRDWEFARAWLRRKLGEAADDSAEGEE